MAGILYIKNEGESFTDYTQRLIENKNVYDLDNQEIYELLFGEKLAPDEARKRLYGVKAYLSQAQSEDMSKVQNLSEFQKIEEKNKNCKK